MRLYRAAEIPDSSTGLWFRESRTIGIIRLLVFGALLAIPIIIGWQTDRPILMWSFRILAAILIPLLLRDVAAQFRSTNWLMCIDSDSVWINLCSYRDRPSDEPSILRLAFNEIVSAGRRTEVYTTPSERPGSGSPGRIGGSTHWRDEYLEFHVTHSALDELPAALNRLRHLGSQVDAQSRRAVTRPPHFTVWLAGPTVLRVPWMSAHDHMVTPLLSEALSRLDGNVRIAEPILRQRASWKELAPAEVDELARELVQVHSATFEAGALLRQAGGLTISDTQRRIREFASEPIGEREAVEWPAAKNSVS